MASCKVIARSSFCPPFFPEYVRLTLPNKLFGGSTIIENRQSSSRICLIASCVDISVEKKSSWKKIAPVCKASRSCIHIACETRGKGPRGTRAQRPGLRRQFFAAKSPLFARLSSASRVSRRRPRSERPIVLHRLDRRREGCAEKRIVGLRR